MKNSTTHKLFIEAAKALQNDPVYLELEEARKANDANTELTKLIDEFETARASFSQLMSSGGEPDKDAIAAANMQVRGLYHEIMETESMKRYNEAKEQLDLLVSYIQASINAAVQGQDPETAELPESCGHDCSSCAGC